MKRFLLAAIFISILFNVRADKLVLIDYINADQLKQYVENPDFNVHHIGQNFVIASITDHFDWQGILLDEDAWQDSEEYYIMYGEKTELSAHLNTNQLTQSIVYQQDNFAVLNLQEQISAHIIPLKNDGLVRIQPTSTSWPKSVDLSHSRSFDPDPFVVGLLEEVQASNITSTVQHLENYGTRDAYTSSSIEAQNWIKQEFENLGLEVELQNFNMPGGSASDNVIATLTGTKYPDEYIVTGGHYDSYSNSSAAPGADDNASGTAGVLEIARILSQYTFDRTIVFCAFSGEEYGLYGSAAYAQAAAQQGMDIHGYFNLDMIAYLQPGSYIHTDLIYPPSAQELADFYTEVSQVYLPDFSIEAGMLTGGDSDHTSFNNNGFMGIFPFEDSDNYSPYIHTANDLVGNSYNNEEQSVVFTQASLAAIATMANLLNPPRNLVALPGDTKVNLEWSPLVDAAYFRIYKNNMLIDSTEETTYLDENVENQILYTYYITAIYEETGEESYPSNTVSVTPAQPISLPLFVDFENGLPYWELTGDWGLTTADFHSSSHSLTESPQGEYPNSIETTATLNTLDMSNMTEANLSFWTKYELETNYDYMYLEITTNGTNWTQIETFNGNQNNWMQKFYSLEEYLGLSYVQLRFRFKSDSYVTEQGMFIDDIEITSTYVGLDENTDEITIYPNPGNGLIKVDNLSVDFNHFSLINTLGEKVAEGNIPLDRIIKTEGLKQGNYLLIISSKSKAISKKIILR